MIIEYVYNKTMEYISSIPKEIRKTIGQFFTPPSVATFMSSLIDTTYLEP